MRKTKIICTIGPASIDDGILKNLMQNGMDVARVNLSHSTFEYSSTIIEKIKRIRAELGLPIGIMFDTKGPEVRMMKFKDGKAMLTEGQNFILTTDKNHIGDETMAAVSYEKLTDDVGPGTRILIDDGLIELKVTGVEDEQIHCKVINGGFVADRKGVNVPSVKLAMPFVSEVDRNDISHGIDQGIDFIAASFATCADDILKIREILDEKNCHSIRIIAKIENREGVNNIDEILKVSDGIMIARGDMGVEIPLQELPAIQKKLIAKAYNAGLQVITATQMLESMIKNPRPTRAESTDVANAIYDGTSAIMLSGETAAGLYPIEAVKVMATIAEWTENDIDYKRRFQLRDYGESHSVTNAISHATCTTAYDLGAKAIITVTKSGLTARMISKYRPSIPIVSFTTEEYILRHLNLSWGVIPMYLEELESTEDLFDQAVENAQKAGLVENGDLVVITAGVPLGVSGTTNLLKVHIVGDVLVSGRGIGLNSVCGNLCVCKDEADALQNFKDGDILVIPQTSNSVMSILKKAKGIITETDGLNTHAAVVGLTLDIPVITGAENATKLLKSGTTVTIDAARGLVSSNS